MLRPAAHIQYHTAAILIQEALIRTQKLSVSDQHSSVPWPRPLAQTWLYRLNRLIRAVVPYRLWRLIRPCSARAG